MRALQRFLPALAGLLLLIALSAPTQAQPCPGGTTPTQDGFCLAQGQAYCGGGRVCSDGMACQSDGRCFWSNGCWPGSTPMPGGWCLRPGQQACAHGGVCYVDRGEFCTPTGCGVQGTGPICADGKPTRVGFVCLPGGRSYDPTTQKVCGTKVCDIRMECGNDACLSPFPQTAALAQRRPQAPKPGEIDINREACSHYAAAIGKANQARATLDQNANIGNHEVRLRMCDLVDRTLDDLVNISGAHCPQRQPELRALLDRLRANACSENKRSYHRMCGGNGTSYAWRDEEGRVRLSPCSTGGGGVRG